LEKHQVVFGKTSSRFLKNVRSFSEKRKRVSCKRNVPFSKTLARFKEKLSTFLDKRKYEFEGGLADFLGIMKTTAQQLKLID